MTKTGTLKVSTNGDREIVLTREFDAPRRLVFEAMTKPEFVRRWLQHVLPRGFVKIRHAGLLSNRRRTERLALCRLLLALAGMVLRGVACLAGVDAPRPGHCCPACGAAQWVVVSKVSPARAEQTRSLSGPDTS